MSSAAACFHRSKHLQSIDVVIPCHSPVLAGPQGCRRPSTTNTTRWSTGLALSNCALFNAQKLWLILWLILWLTWINFTHWLCLVWINLSLASFVSDAMWKHPPCIYSEAPSHHASLLPVTLRLQGRSTKAFLWSTGEHSGDQVYRRLQFLGIFRSEIASLWGPDLTLVWRFAVRNLGSCLAEKGMPNSPKVCKHSIFLCRRLSFSSWLPAQCGNRKKKTYWGRWLDRF